MTTSKRTGGFRAFTWNQTNEGQPSMPKTKLEQDVSDREHQDQVAKERKIKEEATAKIVAKKKLDQYFLDTFNEHFRKLKEKIHVAIDIESHWALFTYEGTRYYIVRTEKWDDTNIPDEGYTPHWYPVWVLRKGSPREHPHFSGFVEGRATEYLLAHEFRLPEHNTYEDVIKGLRKLK